MKDLKTLKEKINNIYYKLNIKTHMPFILNENILFCCFGFNDLKYEYNYFWKIGYINLNSDQEFFLLDTKLPNQSINCSPFIYKENNDYKLSFVANSKQDNNFSMFSYKGDNIETLKEYQITDFIKYGFEYKNNYFYFIDHRLLINNVLILNFLKNIFILKMSNSYLGLTLTIDHIKYGLFELLLNKNNQIKIIKIKNSNISPYKCHLQNDVLAYTKKGDGFEDRIIDFTHDFYFENIPEEIMKDIYIVNDWSSYI